MNPRMTYAHALPILVNDNNEFECDQKIVLIILIILIKTVRYI
jgi:hypothetical protein